MIRFVFIASISALLAVFLWFVFALTPPRGLVTTSVTIAEGSGVNAISRTLKQANVIRSSLLFETLVWLWDAEGSMQAGTYEFGPKDSLIRLIERLRSGDLTARDRITFIEGRTLTQYRAVLEENGYDTASFDRLIADPAAWRDQYWFAKEIPEAQTMEGYVFPDTYAIDAERSSEALIKKMLDNFETKITDELRAQLTKTLTLHEAITLASIVEAEVQTFSDRQRVAHIFLKRLDAGMPLQSDATINYVTKSGRARSNADDLAIDSAYNTYKYTGLPPGPIGNPGLDAIRAVAEPLENDSWYFLTDAEGRVHYGRTFEEHQENRRNYLE